MEKLTEALTDYVISKGIVDEDDRVIYEYGFEITIEVGLFALFCVFITLYLHMFFEGILFFIIFAPLRSYAGGLHLKNYYSCFILSCLTFLGVLLVIRYIHAPNCTYFILFLIFGMTIYMLYPVENLNRKVDSEENRYFKNKLRVFLLLDLFLAVVCIYLKNNNALCLITTTFLVVLITMLIGKYKNRNMYLPDK